jgi:hypothetical protein
VVLFRIQRPHSDVLLEIVTLRGEWFEVHSLQMGKRSNAGLGKRSAITLLACLALVAGATSGCSVSQDAAAAPAAVPSVPSLPPEVTNLTATVDGTTGKLAWTAPGSVNGMTGFRLLLDQGDPVTVGPEITSYDLPNLEQGKKHYFQVTTITKEGPSFPAEVYLDVPYPVVTPKAASKAKTATTDQTAQTGTTTNSGSSSTQGAVTTAAPQAAAPVAAAPASQAFKVTGTATVATSVDAGKPLSCDDAWKSISVQILEEHDAFEADAKIETSGKVIGDPIVDPTFTVYSCAYTFTATVSGDSSIYTFRLYSGTKLAGQSKWKTSDLRSGTTPMLST